MMRSVVLHTYRLMYEQALRPLMFHAASPMQAHASALAWCRWFDQHPTLLAQVRQFCLPSSPILVGGVQLPSPLMLAAGFVKGMGFADQESACQAVDRGVNIIPGWRSMPALVGAVEFGSFTPHPRLGNDGSVLWRNPAHQALQNRIGLKNPGVAAAAAFLGRHRRDLPRVFGVNLAPTPGIVDTQRESTELADSIHQFASQGVQPTWFTINLSCPNTEDDPTGRQTESQARAVCRAVIAATDLPIWIKISPNLDRTQYQRLATVFAEEGVRAVITTNTLPAPTPDNPAVTAGVSGRPLHPFALEAAQIMQAEAAARAYPFDVIGCGGLLDGAGYQAYQRIGIKAIQFWSALIYRGPLAAALIWQESRS